MGVALTVCGLVKGYLGRNVVDGVDLTVPYASVVCLVGPNGSGKTTLVECVEGLRRPDAGTIDILGERYPFGRKRPARLGVQLQEESLPARIRVGEALEYFRRLYGAPAVPAQHLAALGIDQIARAAFGTLSGGQKRRVVVALALVGAPRLVVLDEPLAGLDPDGQQCVLDLLDLLRGGGTGVLVTLHDLDQAAALADRVVLLSSGRVVAAGSPAELVAGLGATSVAVLPQERPVEPAAVGASRVVRHAHRTYVYGADALRDSALEVRPVNLHDVYACATGTTTYQAEVRA